MTNPENRNQWWDPTITEDAAGSALVVTLEGLRTRQATRMSAGIVYEATYEQENVFAAGNMGYVGGGGLNLAGLGGGEDTQLVTYNAMQIGFDTLVSKLTQADAQVRFLTDGGNWEQRKKAEELEKLVKGEFYRLDYYAVKESVMLDMLLHGKGFMKFYADHATKRPCCTRQHPMDVFYDEIEARDNPPVTMYCTRIVSKAALIADYASDDAALAEKIRAATIMSGSKGYSNRGTNATDVCEVVEGWRLPSYEGAGDGMYLCAVSSGALCRYEYEQPEFPFAVFTWTQRRRGPYAISAAEQTIFLQRNLNKMIQRRAECLYMLSAPYILSEEAAEVNPASFESAGVGNFITYASGRAPPTIVVNKVVPEDLNMNIEQTKRDIAETLGINGLESIGQKPGGIESAVALQQFTESTSLRHVKTLKENERFTISAARQLLRVMKELLEEYGEYKAFGQGADEVEEIKLSEADLPPEAFQMQMAPANLLPNTVGGRLQAVTQIADTGALTPKQVLRLLKSPDIAAATDDATAADQDIEWTIYEMVKKNGRYLPPEAAQDLQLGVQEVTNAYLKARRQNAPDEVLERLDMWKATAQSMLEEQSQASQQQQMQMVQGQQDQVVQQTAQKSAELKNAKEMQELQVEALRAQILQGANPGPAK